MIHKLNILFNNFSKFDKETIKQANNVKREIVNFHRWITNVSIKEIQGIQRKKLLCYETIGFIPLEFELLSIEYLEWIYTHEFNHYWNDFIDYEDFVFALKREPKDIEEIKKYVSLDNETQVKIMLKYKSN